MEITSVSNELVKKTAKLQQKKYRNLENRFLLEGFKAIKEAFDYGIELEYIFVNKNKKNEYNFAKNLVIDTNDVVLKKLATTDSAPEAVAVGLQKKYDKNMLKNSKKIVLLEDIKDLGNLGTIIRSSVAFGADGIILYGESVDIYNPKAVRAAVGNLWKIPIFQMKTIEELKEYFQDFNIIATLPRSNNLLKTYNVEFPAVIMFGSEANGLSKELINFATNSVKIEMSKNVESLNLATSVSVVLYKLFV
jgi:TrmH family RNA methyltransferase